MTADALSQQVAATAAGAIGANRPGAMHATGPDQAKKVGQKFEAMFVTQMFQQMFTGMKTDGWFGGGHGEEIFRPMLIEQYGKLVAQHGGGIGIADAVARTLLRTQEVQ